LVGIPTWQPKDSQIIDPDKCQFSHQAIRISRQKNPQVLVGLFGGKKSAKQQQKHINFGGWISSPCVFLLSIEL